MKMDLIIFITFFIINIEIIVYLVYNNKFKKRKFAFDKYLELMTIVEKSKLIAFEKVWREDLMAYTTSSMSIENKDLKEPIKEFLHLFFGLCGENIKKDLISIHGNLDSVVEYLVNDFISMVIEKELVIKERIRGGQTIQEPLNPTYSELVKLQ